MPQGLPRKLRYAFVLQAAMASFAIVIGIFAVSMFAKDMLAVDRLHTEADAWRAGRANDPAYPLPRTSTVRGWYLPTGADPATLPDEIRDLPVGVTRFDDSARKILVEDEAGGRLYISMKFSLVERLVLLTSLFSAVFALGVLYVVTWVTYRRSKRLVVPVSQLAGAVARWDPRDPGEGLDPFDDGTGSEVSRLGGALRDLATRTRDFVQRERDFTRDASHELRTPLTVIRVATDMMLGDAEASGRLSRPLQRIQRAGRDMEALIDAFLILAREGDVEPQVEDFQVRDVVLEEMDKVRPLLADKAIELRLVEEADPCLHASPRVLAVMVGNLLENACTFTESGSIEIRIGADRLAIVDTGIGMSADILRRVYDPFYRADQFSPVGKGMGLSIVRRLGERFRWPVTLESTPGEGTTASIDYSAVPGC